MKLKKPENSNYCGMIVEIKQLVPLDNCDNVIHAIIMGNSVIVGKDTKIGDVGIFFPVETQLSKEYLIANNLYRKKELNNDKEKAGYFEENGRIRCVKFRQNKSEGLLMPRDSISFVYKNTDEYITGLELDLNIGVEFDELNDIKICQKYIPKHTRTPGIGSKQGKKPKESKIIDGQFHFHQDTGQLYRNLHRINPEDVISITYKVHGTSGISSKVLCKRKLSLFERLLKGIGVNVSDKHYDYLYSSRKVLKNADLNPNANHYYNEDIWGVAHNDLKEFLQDGMTIYFEIVGYLPSGGIIQKDYDYGCKSGEYKIFIYRITYTNPSGKVFEFSAKQVQDWCKKSGLNAVPRLYYGTALLYCEQESSFSQEFFLEKLKKDFNEKDCYLSNNKVPEEGCVVRIEREGFEAYKCKSEKFYLRETKLLDKGENDIEEEN